jgi:predicted anti-sigma-YlaC factor YlaD
VIFLWTDREREALPFGRVERHLGECPRCRERAEQLERLARILRANCRRPAVPARLVERIRISIERD